MRPRLAGVFVLIVLLPLAVLGWLGLRASHNEEEVVRHNFQDVLHDKLKDIDKEISALFQQRERSLGKLTEQALFAGVTPATNKLSAADGEFIRELIRRDPLVSQIFVLMPDGSLLHPALDGDMTASEREFLRRARRPLMGRELVQPAAANDTTAAAKSKQTSASNQGNGGRNAAAPTGQSDGQGVLPAQGWYVWYWDNGINLIYWHRLGSGHVVGVELERSRLLADIMARLPNTNPDDPALPNGSIELVDSNGSAFYRWGGYTPGEKETPRAELSASSPLSSWRLNYYMPSADLDAALKGKRAFSYAAFAAMGLALLGLAIYFYREYSRDVRDAAQRVNFVNQVSHELKTPLTNIRMYAEMLESQLPITHGDDTGPNESEGKTRHYLNVIVAESQRLSRLIGNVLLFGRQQKQAHALHTVPGVIDDCIGATLEQFRPAFEAKGIRVQGALHATALVVFDADALGQILGNLFSNVEKYAAAGRLMEIVSSQKDGVTQIEVSDKGQGIPIEHREKIFEPFYRVSDSLADGVTGTGIGLTIARELARLHGGELSLDTSSASPGTHFALILKTPLAKEPRTSASGQTSQAAIDLKPYAETKA